jgi:hypothetical protein
MIGKEDCDGIGNKILNNLGGRIKECDLDKMPIGLYIDKPNGGTTLYLRHDAVSFEGNRLSK